MANIRNGILSVAPKTNMPVEWCQIFANCVQRVADRLGVELEARPGGRGHCIFITPKTLGYSGDSITNLNFAGFDYAEAWKKPGHAFDSMILLNLIYREDRRVALKIKALIDKIRP